MYAIHTYEEIIKQEERLQEHHLIILLFIRPSLPQAKAMIEEFDYLHFNAGKYCSIYAIGYTNDQRKQQEGFHLVCAGTHSNWYFSDQAFVSCKNQLEQRLKWNYSGEIEMILLQSNPEGRQILNFQNYVPLDLSYGIRQQYLDSFPRFMEQLIRAAKSEVTAKQALAHVKRQRYSLSKIALESIDACKKIPRPAKVLLKDQLFFSTKKIKTMG